jgi:hypothetical protein
MARLTDRQRKLWRKRESVIRRFRKFPKKGMHPTTILLLYLYLEELNPRMGLLTFIGQEELGISASIGRWRSR